MSRDLARRNQELRKLMVVLSVLFVLVMVWVALSGAELPTYSRRPTSDVTVTWPTTPIRFLFAAMPLYFMTLLVGIIGHAILRPLFSRKG